MLQGKKYKKVYTAYDDSGNIQLLFYNGISADALLVDGFNFTYKPIVEGVPAGFEELKDVSSNGIYEVEKIKQSDDITFIKFINGDLFQLYSIPNGNDGFKQVLSIFKKERDSQISTPLGVSIYDAALSRLNEAEEYE